MTDRHDETPAGQPSATDPIAAEPDDQPAKLSGEVDKSLLARGFSVQVVGRGLSMALSVVSIAVTIRYLGVDKYGILTAAVVFSGVFDAFADIGLGTITIRRAAQGRDTLEHLVGLNLGVSLIYAAPLWLVTSVAGLLVYSGRPDYQLGVAIVASSLVLRAIATCYDPMFQVRGRFSIFAAYDLGGRLCGVTFMLVAVFLDLGLVAFFVVQVVPNVARLLIEYVAARQMGRFRPVFNRADIVSLVREGMPLAAVMVIAVVYYRADGVILSLVSSERQVGSYGLGYRLAATLAFIPQLFNTVAFPTLAATYAAGRDRFNSFSARCLEVMGLFAMPLALFGCLFAKELVVLFGSRSVAPLATVPTQYVLAATAVGFLNFMLGQSLIAAHDQRFLVWMSLGTLFFNIAANIAVDPHFGAAGAGAALLGTEILSVAVSSARLRHVTAFPYPLAHTMRLLGAAAATVAAWALTRTHGLPVIVPTVAAVFVAALALAGPLRPDEVRALIAMLRRRSAPESDVQPA